jgi:flagellar hook protein FlgE
MMRSMFAGVTGLRSHQTMMDVVGNNIANVNTPGFKASQVTFAETISQVLGGASGAAAIGDRGDLRSLQSGRQAGHRTAYRRRHSRRWILRRGSQR